MRSISFFDSWLTPGLVAWVALGVLAQPSEAACPPGPVPESTVDVTVPAGCHFMLVKAWGSGGSRGRLQGPAGTGGGGAGIVAQYEVVPGEVYRRRVIDPIGAAPSPGFPTYMRNDDPNRRYPILIAGGGGAGGFTVTEPGFPPDAGAGGAPGQDGEGTHLASGLEVEGGSGGVVYGGFGGSGEDFGDRGGSFECWILLNPPFPPCGSSRGGGHGGRGHWGGGGGGAGVTQPGSGAGGGATSFVAGVPNLIGYEIFNGYRTTPGNALDPERGGAGEGGTTATQTGLGTKGRIVIRFDALSIVAAPAGLDDPPGDTPAHFTVQSPVDLASATLEVTNEHGDTVALAPALTALGRINGMYVYRLSGEGGWRLPSGDRLAAGEYGAVVKGVPVGADHVLTSETTTVRVDER